MSISSEIFDEVFNKLREDEEFPNSVVDGLQELLESGETISPDKIFEVIKGKIENVR